MLNYNKTKKETLIRKGKKLLRNSTKLELLMQSFTFKITIKKHKESGSNQHGVLDFNKFRCVEHFLEKKSFCHKHNFLTLS